jgi:peptidoglycan/LPS O-acetylase OafA/YrhL
MNAPERLAVPRAPRANIAINNLRAAVVVFVVAAHSIIAYLWSLPPRPFAFDKPPFSWRTFPIVDTHHFIGFDILCAWADLFLMALFFLMSGLFVWQSLERNGALDFAYRRVLRLGPPFVFGIAVLMPLTNYTTYMQTAAHPGLADFWMHWRALPFWPAGPNWFLWVLLVADISAALFFALLPRGHRIVLGLSRTAREHPARFLAGLLAASTLAYVPFGILFGPMSWFQWGPFSFQLSFPGLYAVYFFAGIIIGACGVEESLLTRSLARHWKLWLASAPLLFGAWLGASAMTYGNPAATSLAWNLVNAIALPPACFASCCCALALAMRFARARTRLLDSLQRNAYGIYLLHYLFVAWLQFALLPAGWPAIVKASIVFAGAMAFSWALSSALRRVPGLDSVIGSGRPAPVSAVMAIDSRSAVSVAD